VSNDLNQTWLTYNGNTTIKVWFPPEVAGRIPEIPRVFVGIDDSPNSSAAFDSGANYTQAVGQLAIFNVLNVYPRDPADGGPVYPRNPADGGPGGSPLNSGQPVGGGVEITNSSCATYFAHIEVAFLPEESALASNPAVLPPGAGGPADGGFEASD
jgi:hypothetical protein